MIPIPRKYMAYSEDARFFRFTGFTQP
jgi:hypothetical protein